MTPYTIHFKLECHNTFGPFNQPLTKQIHLFLQNYVGMYGGGCECVTINQNLIHQA